MIIVRGYPLSSNIQVGYSGAPHQVLQQQHETEEGRVVAKRWTVKPIERPKRVDYGKNSKNDPSLLRSRHRVES